MAAGTHDIIIEQGATFKLNIVWNTAGGTPIDVTGFTARMQVRQKYSSTTAALSLTSGAGDIVLGGALGTVDVTAGAIVTDDIPFRVGVYDLELVSPGGEVTRLLQGSVTVSPEVTR